MNTCPELEALDHLDRIAIRHLIEHKGRVTCLREFGAGAPLVLLHGGHGSWLGGVLRLALLGAVGHGRRRRQTAAPACEHAFKARKPRSARS
jgi:hypothetical protein